MRNVVIITIDTLRADHVGAYGYGAARTPAMDALARERRRFDRAYATAPITLTSHASLMTGRYPPGHGARHNGMRIDLKTPTLAEHFARAGFATAAFVAAFPLDRRFGLDQGIPGHTATPCRATPTAASPTSGPDAWSWTRRSPGPTVTATIALLLWVHLFEPHAPYGNPVSASVAQRSALVRATTRTSPRRIGRWRG